MTSAPIPENEPEKIKTLRALEILDTPNEDRLGATGHDYV